MHSLKDDPTGLVASARRFHQHENLPAILVAIHAVAVVRNYSPPLRTETG